MKNGATESQIASLCDVDSGHSVGGGELTVSLLHDSEQSKVAELACCACLPSRMVSVNNLQANSDASSDCSPRRSLQAIGQVR